MACLTGINFSTINGQWKFDIQEENIPFYKDLNDHLERIVDSTETYRDLVNSTLDTYYSIISGKSIEKLNLLTVISTIMLPLTVIVFPALANVLELSVRLPFTVISLVVASVAAPFIIRLL